MSRCLRFQWDCVITCQRWRYKALSVHRHSAPTWHAASEFGMFCGSPALTPHANLFSFSTSDLIDMACPNLTHTSCSDSPSEFYQGIYTRYYYHTSFQHSGHCNPLQVGSRGIVQTITLNTAGQRLRKMKQEVLTVSPRPGEISPSFVNSGSTAAAQISKAVNTSSVDIGRWHTSSPGYSSCTRLSPSSDAKIHNSLIWLTGEA